MDLFVGLDVSLNSASVCILEGGGTLVWQGRLPRIVPEAPAALPRT